MGASSSSGEFPKPAPAHLVARISCTAAPPLLCRRRRVGLAIPVLLAAKIRAVTSRHAVLLAAAAVVFAHAAAARASGDPARPPHTRGAPLPAGTFVLVVVIERSSRGAPRRL